MLTLPEWLKLVGLQGQNPFANKQADNEQDWLEECFVEHPAYNAMTSEANPHSSILHAARGAGKTTACTMFERLCREEASHRRALVVRLNEWIPLVDLLDKPMSLQVNGYLEALFGHVVAALPAICDAPWMSAPTDPSLRAYLAWFTRHYGGALTDDELARLTQSSHLFGSSPPPTDAAPHRLSHQPPLQQLKWLLRALRAAGVSTLYVLVDRVDEVAVTVAHPERGADLLLPLLGNLELLELEGLVVKCFIPTSMVAVLQARQQLRDDRIRCYDLTWADADGLPLLRRLLQNRLGHFSRGTVPSLAVLADSDLRDIDERVSRAANGSPRQLLIIGENLLLARAADATERDLLIRQHHLDLVLADGASPTQPTRAAAFDSAALSSAQSPPVALASEQEPPAPIAPIAPPAKPVASAVPLLTLGADGSVARGGTPIEGWQQLPSRQREVIRYLFSKPDVLCHYSELGRKVWHDAQVGDDTVRKVLARLITFLDKNSPNVVYIEKVIGGYYVLRHAVATPYIKSQLWAEGNDAAS